MRTPVLSLIIALIFQSGISSAQTPEKALLQFESGAFNLMATKNGQLAIATKMGEVAFADSTNGFWRKTSVHGNVGGSFAGTTLDNTCFFNSDTAFVPGFISSETGKYNIIYHTVNGGETWKPIEFGLDGWVDDATFLDNGEAWLSVGGAGIAYSKDYGFTWTSFSIPNKKERFTKIYFNKKRQGIIGSLWNVLAYTGDNCKNWINIPTPLSQDKYRKTNISGRPAIDRVAIFNDYLLVSQENLVFYSRRDTINWIFMPNYIDFYTDAENSALFFKTRKRDFIKCDSSLKPLSLFDNGGGAYSAVCRNGSLYFLGQNIISQITADNQLVETPLYTNKIADMEPVIFAYTNDGIYGSIGNIVYNQKEYKGKWDYAFTLPFSTYSGSLSMKDSATVLFSRLDDSLFYYSIPDAKVEKKHIKEIMESFCGNRIQKIIFSKGSQGCFHSYKDELVYEYINNAFQLTHDRASGSKHSRVLKDNAETIDPEIVEEFVKKLPVIYHKNASIDDLGFTEKDYTTCRKNIQKYIEIFESKGKKDKIETPFNFNENNLDFARLLALVDSIKTLDQKTLNYCLLSWSDLWSTTSQWAMVALVNERDEKLVIKNSYYMANPFYFPWKIELNGSVTNNNAIDINRFIAEVYPNFLDSSDKVKVLQQFVKLLYKSLE
jgi:hypothetical protein